MDDATRDRAVKAGRRAAAGTYDTPAGALLDAIVDEAYLALEALTDEHERRFRDHVGNVRGIAVALARYVDDM